MPHFLATATGRRFEAALRIDGAVLDDLDSLTVMEPSHQPFNVLAHARCCGHGLVLDTPLREAASPVMGENIDVWWGILDSLQEFAPMLF